MIMTNSKSKIDSIVILRQKIENSRMNNFSESELSLSQSEILNLIDEIEVERLELAKQNEELLLHKSTMQNSILELKQTEAMLQHERELYLDLVNNQPAGIYRIRVFSKEKWEASAWRNSENPPYCMELASDRFCEILEISRQEFEDNPAIISDLIHPQDIESFTLRNEEANAKLISFRWEGRLLIKEKTVWIHLESIPRCVANGEVLWTGILYDITSQKQDENALKDSENKYRELVDNSPDAIAILSEGNIVFVNNECVKLLNAKSADELIGRMGFEFIHPDYRSFTHERMIQAIDNGKILPLAEEKYIRCDGFVIDVEVKSMPIMFQHKPSIQIIVRDITDKKLTEIALKESEEKFRNVFEYSLLGKSLTTMDGRLHVNKAFCEIIGYSEQELNNLSWQDITYVDDVRFKEDEIKLIVKGEKKSSRFQSRFVHKNGSIIWADISTFLQRDDTGKPQYFITSINNITDQRLAEIGLTESWKNFKDLFDNAPVGYHEIDAEGKIVRMNQTELTMLGYAESEIIGRYIWEIADCDAETKQQVKKKLKGQNVPLASFETTLVSKNGSVYSILVQDKVLRDDTGKITGIRSTIQDISERKNAECKIRRIGEHYQALIENAPDGIALLDPQGNFKFVSRSARKILGYEMTDKMKPAPAEMTYPADLHLVMSAFEQIFKSPTLIPTLQYRLYDKNGNCQWIESTFTNLLADPSVESIVMNFKDITQKKQAEEALRESEERYKSISDNSNSAIFIINESCRVEWVNQNALIFSGYSMEQILEAQSFTDFVAPESVGLASLNFGKLIAGEEYVPQYQMYMIHSNGEKRLCDKYTTHYIDRYGKLKVIVIMTDITEQKKNENALKQSKELLNKLLYANTDFIDSKSEDIDYVKMTDILLEISGAKYAVFNLLDVETNEYTTLAISGLSNALSKIKSIFGYELINKRWAADPIKEEKVSKSNITKFDTVRELAQTALSRTVIALVEKTFNVEETFVVKIVKSNKIIGEFVLLYTKGETLQNVEIVELFANQAGLYLDRESTNKSLRESEEKYRYLFANNPQPMYIFDMETLDFVEVNEAAIQHYGYSKEEFLHMNAKDIRPKEDIPMFLKDIQSERRSFKPVGEWRHVKKNGQIISVEISTVSVKSNGRDVCHVMIHDITERKRAEEALRISEEKFRSITEQISDYISISDTAGVIQYASPAAKSMFQYDPNELLGQNFMNYIDDESLSLAFAAFKAGIDQRIKAINLELKLKRKDGSTFFAEVNGSTVIYGSENRILVIIHDITERKKFVGALQESEDKYRTMIENSNDLIWALDREGNFTFMNRKGLDTTGLVYEDWIGKSFVPLVFPEDITRLMDVLNRSMAGENCNFEFRFKKADGSILLISVNTSPVFTNGEIVGVVSFGRDITEEKLALQALSESEELYRNLVQRIPDGVYKSTSAGRFVDVNPAMIKMLGYESKEDMLNLDIKSQLYFKETDRESLVLKDMYEETGVYRLKKQDGTEIWVEDHGWYNVDENGNILFHEGILRDVTERKLAEVQLEEKMGELLRFHKMTVDRELMMIELKKEINQMLVHSGKPEKYKIV